MSLDGAVRTTVSPTAATVGALIVLLLSAGPAFCQDGAEGADLPTGLDVRGEIAAFMASYSDTTDSLGTAEPPGAAADSLAAVEPPGAAADSLAAAEPPGATADSLAAVEPPGAAA
ncbi:MAG: hypothetical protein KAW67_10900, partial [Candidatus Eisenbacteria sp.]|nr:hypothetical protein [Candidatus Eisenbacteria bacterium]